MTTRYLTFCGFLVAFAAALTGFLFEYGLGFDPCLLCVIERGVFVVIAAILFIAFLHNRLKRSYLIASFAFILLGVVAAARQVWLQVHPAQNEGVCVPGLSYLIHQFSPLEVVKFIAGGTEQCAEVSWSFLGLSMAAWALIMFIVVGFFVVQGLRRVKESTND